MTYNLNGKNIRIPDAEINKSMKLLEISHDEAVQMWLEDEEYLENEVVEELTAKDRQKSKKSVNFDRKFVKMTNFRSFFCAKFLLDNRKNMWYNWQPAHDRAGPSFVSIVMSHKNSSKICAKISIDIFPKPCYN